MRLINCTSLNSLRLEQFDVTTAPKYAILSHTWEKDAASGASIEVTYENFETCGQERTQRNASGWAKIEGACKAAQAIDHNIQFVWVDSCCIDKKNGAELAEAINSSMYSRCVVMMSLNNKHYAGTLACLDYIISTSTYIRRLGS